MRFGLTRGGEYSVTYNIYCNTGEENLRERTKKPRGYLCRADGYNIIARLSAHVHTRPASFRSSPRAHFFFPFTLRAVKNRRHPVCNARPCMARRRRSETRVPRTLAVAPTRLSPHTSGPVAFANSRVRGVPVMTGWGEGNVGGGGRGRAYRGRCRRI